MSENPTVNCSALAGKIALNFPTQIGPARSDQSLHPKTEGESPAMDIHAHENYLANREAAEFSAEAAGISGASYYVEADQTFDPQDCAVIALAPGYLARTVDEKTSVMTHADDQEVVVGQEFEHMADLLPGSVFEDEELTRTLIEVVGQDTAMTILRSLQRGDYSRVDRDITVGAYQVNRPDDETYREIGRTLIDSVMARGGNGTVTVRVSAQ